MNVLDAVVCRLARWLEPGGLDALFRGHRRRCARCVERALALARVEQALRALDTAPPALPVNLRPRVLDAVERELRARERLAPPRELLGRATLASGALAVALLVAAVFASRIDSWREPPRRVHIVLPPGTRAVDEPVLIVRRASGREERR